MDSFKIEYSEITTLQSGEYNAFIVELEKENCNLGGHIIWTFALASDHLRYLVSGITSTKLSPDTDLYQWASAALGNDSFLLHVQGFSPELLLQRQVRIRVTNFEIDGVLFSEVADIISEPQEIRCVIRDISPNSSCSTWYLNPEKNGYFRRSKIGFFDED